MQGMAKIRQFDELLIWQDEHYAVINKPPFTATLEDRNDPVNILSMARKSIPEAQVGHRLDKETSGALIITKNAEAYRHISMQFEHREVKKEYHAVVEGIHDFKNFIVNDPILKLSNGTVRINYKGKDAQTIFHTERAYKQHTLIRCHPVTGRMHQIRIHLSHYGAPIIGDTTYGGKPFYLSSIKRNYRMGKWDEEQPLIKRLALHASKISFTDMQGQPVAVEAPQPKDFRVLLIQLDKNA